MASSTSAYVRERANRSPSDSSVPRTSALVRIACTPTSRAGMTMREKPKSSLRWRVTLELERQLRGPAARPDFASARRAPSEDHVRLNKLVGPVSAASNYSLEIVEEADNLGARPAVGDGYELTGLHASDSQTIPRSSGSPARVSQNELDVGD